MEGFYFVVSDYADKVWPPPRITKVMLRYLKYDQFSKAIRLACLNRWCHHGTYGKKRETLVRKVECVVPLVKRNGVCA